MPYCLSHTARVSIAVLLLLKVAMAEELLYGIITPTCWNVFLNDNDFTNVDCIKLVMSKVLGYAIIAGSFLLKLPQILKIIQAGDVTGLDASAFYMEVLIFICNSVYNVLQGYPLSTWGENLVILVQNLFLVLLLWTYSNPPASMLKRLAILSVFCICAFGMFNMPQEYQFLLAFAGIPMTVAARIPQIIVNFKNGHTGQLAVVTLILNLGGSATRLFTTLQETGDTIQLTGYLVSVLLNGLLVLQVFAYWNATTKALQTAKSKKSQ